MRSLLKTIFVCVSIFVVAGSLAAQTTTTTAPGGTNGSQKFTVFNAPPCDFNNTFYEANGVLANSSSAELNQPGDARFGLFRLTGPPATKNGQKNWVNDSTCPVNNPDDTNVRILATTAGYLDDGSKSPTDFISIIAFAHAQAFFNGGNFTLQEGDNTVSITNGLNPRGFSTETLVGSFEAYAGVKQTLANGTFARNPCSSGMASPAAPATPCFSVSDTTDSSGNILSDVATPNLRQDWRFSSNRNAIDASSGGPGSPFGYFCDDLLGMWVITYFWFVNTAQTNATCGQMLSALASINGTSLDGTPIIKTADELNFLEGTKVGSNPIPGFSGSSPPSPPCTAEGQEDVGGADGGAVWLICPAILDPRNGAIAVDAFIDQVLKPSGAPLDPAFTNNFNCLQTTGDFKGSTACP